MEGMSDSVNLRWWKELRGAIAQLDLALLGMSEDSPDFALSVIAGVCADWMRARRGAAERPGEWIDLKDRMPAEGELIEVMASSDRPELVELFNGTAFRAEYRKDWFDVEGRTREAGFKVEKWRPAVWREQWT